jgi:putative MFS transporter
MATTATADGAQQPATTVDEAIERIGVGRFQWRLFFINGFTWAADAMEVLIIGFVIPGIMILWGLDRTVAALVASATFVGMFVGAWGFGALADRFGRRRIFILTVVLDAVFGLLSALSQNFEMLLILRFLTGVAVGGTLPVDYAVMAEFLPARRRGAFLVYLESFWAVGTVLVALLAWALIALNVPESASWRYLLVLSALPGVIGFWIRRNVPESPRYLISRGRADEARAVLQQIARMNGSQVEIGELRAVPSATKAPLTQIWRSPLLRRTLLLSAIWFSLSLGYYGIFTWLPGIFRAQGFEALPIYENLLLLALAQVPGYMLAAYLVEKIGRRWTLAGFLFGSAAASYWFAVADSSIAIIIGGMMMSFALLGAWGALYAYTPELYPTDARGTGMGWASAMARVAGIMAPLLGATLLDINLVAALSVYVGFFVLAGCATLFLTYETRGRTLTDTSTTSERNVGMPSQA